MDRRRQIYFKYYKRFNKITAVLHSKQQKKCRPPSSNEGEQLPEAGVNITLEVMEDSSNAVENRNLCKRDNTSMTASAVAAMEINLPRFKTHHQRLGT